MSTDSLPPPSTSIVAPAITRADDNVYLDAVALAKNLFGSHMPANMIVVGAAYQAGLLPLSAETIERTIAINGVAVDANVQAFRVGRMVVANPAWEPLAELERPGAQGVEPVLTPDAQKLVDSMRADGELRRLLEIRVPELIEYQDEAYARRYVEFVRRVQARESEITDERRLSEAVARYLFKLMAYKDEYEVARLHLRSEFQRELEEEFGENPEVTYHLHPPFMRALGLERKIGFGTWFDSVYRLLAKMKVLRGTPLDIFGYAHVR